MGRMKDINIEQQELIEAVADIEMDSDNFEEQTVRTGDYLAELGWLSPTEATALRRNHEEATDAFKVVAAEALYNIVLQGGTHSEAGAFIATEAIMRICDAAGVTDQEMLDVAEYAVKEAECDGDCEPEPLAEWERGLLQYADDCEGVKVSDRG